MTTDVSAEFVWSDDETGRALRSTLLSFTPHVFTTRDLRLRDVSDEQRLASLVDVEVGQLLRLHQVHGREVVMVTPGVAWTPQTKADAIVSTDPSRAIAVLVADCVPILLADRQGRAVAAIHAGWRGTAAGIVGATVDAIGALGVEPADLVAAVGPSAGPCCYQVDDVVRDAFAVQQARAERWFAEDGAGHWKLDLWRANVDQLVAAGLLPAHVASAASCTIHHPETYFSYRRDGAGTGRLAAAIKLTSVR